MTEQRLKVESGPPQHMIDEPVDTPPAQSEEPGKAEQVKEQAQQAAAPVQEKVQAVAAPAKEKAREVAGQAKEHAQAAAGQAKDKAAAQIDEKSTQVGQQVGSQAEALDGVADELRRQGKDGQAKVAAQAAEKVKDVGDYLEQADGASLVDSAQRLAQENPAAAAAVGAAAGFVAGRVLKASSPDDGSGDDQPAAATPDQAVPDPGPGAP
jgi:alanyl-tRNA synthetase